MKASSVCFAVLLVLPLTGCETAHYSTDTLGVDEYAVTVTPPGGMIAGLVGLSPSKSTLLKIAAEKCPSGYKKLREEHGYAENEYIRWEIRCRI